MLHKPRHTERNTRLANAQAKAEYTKLVLNDFHALETLVRDDAQCRVHRIMTTDLYKVGIDDAVDLVSHLMRWKRVGHVPVEDAGSIVGLVTEHEVARIAQLLVAARAEGTAGRRAP